MVMPYVCIAGVEAFIFLTSLRPYVLTSLRPYVLTCLRAYVPQCSASIEGALPLS